MKLVFLIAVLHFSQILLAQQSVVANTRRSGIVYLGVDNPLNILTEGYACSSLSVTTDNGRIEKIGCFYNYRPSRLGLATFTIYKRQRGKTIKVDTRNLYVKPVPKPIAQVGPYESGSQVPKTGLSVQEGVAAYATNELGFDLTYKVDSFTIVIMYDSTVQFSSRRASNRFDDKIYEAFKAMQPGSIVLVANTWVKGYDGKPIKLDPLEYVIK